ncbi:MAG: hypothetical protein H7Y13_03855 [Sphingobacteriaceae bacterium]|nr:hypothetical protein [Sphingobacteriaceae bacterium]
MENLNHYESFKRGVKKDLIATGTNLIGGLGFFFFLWFLLMVLWYAVASGAGNLGRLVAVIFLIVIVPCLFIRRTANIILSIWGTLLIVLVYSIIIIPLLYFVYIMWGGAFGLI